MKQWLIIMALIIGLFFENSAQNSPIGIWKDTLKITATQQLEVVLVISKKDSLWTCVMDSPNQFVTDIPVSKFQYIEANDSILVEIKHLGVNFKGKYIPNQDVIEGIFTQSYLKKSLKLKRAVERLTFSRPQNPQPPYPYKVENISFKNEQDHIVLNGILTIPDTITHPLPAVILISGSGWQDKDESLMGHKPFLIIADYLTRKGIAVLRFDDRPYSQYIHSTTFDFVKDVKAAFDFLQKDMRINDRQIGLCGHSEGGLVATIAASENQDIAFVISMAGALIPMIDIMHYQGKAIWLKENISEKYIDELLNCNHAIYTKLLKYKPKQNQRFLAFSKKQYHHLSDSAKIVFHIDSNEYKKVVMQLVTPWWIEILKINPDDYLNQVNCSMYLINGAEDIQVPKISLEEVALKYPFKFFETKEYPSLNHLFQHCQTCKVEEYGQLEETISPEVLKDISNWILRQIQFR